MKVTVIKAACVLAVLSACGCASTPVESANALSNAYTAHTALLVATDIALDAHAITVAQARNVLNASDVSAAILTALSASGLSPAQLAPLTTADDAARALLIQSITFQTT